MPKFTIYRLTHTSLLSRLVAFGLLALIVVGNSLLFPRLFGTSYLAWYVSTGAIVALAVAALDVVTDDLEEEKQLVSADAMVYAHGCLIFCGLLYYSLGTALRVNTADRSAEADVPYALRGSAWSRCWDFIWHFALTVMIAIGGFAWLLLYAPLNYFVHLVVAAPARHMLRGSSYRTLLLTGPAKLEGVEWPSRQPTPPHAVDISFNRKPFAFTQVLLAAVLWLGGALVTQLTQSAT